MFRRWSRTQSLRARWILRLMIFVDCSEQSIPDVSRGYFLELCCGLKCIDSMDHEGPRFGIVIMRLP